ncbi:MAG: type IX secretion system sortase PorU, partial [Bacteroidales bacterium]
MNLNEASGLFEHEVNLYSDFTFYFLNFDLGEGKRIQTQYSSIIPPTYISTSFNDYYYHELELENLIHSGRMWYGEHFDETLEYTYTIEFPNILLNHPVSFTGNAAARSWAPSNFSFEVNEQAILTLAIPPVNYSNNNSDYAKLKKDSTSFLAESAALDLTVMYDNPTGYSTGWLDYFIFNARRQNIFNGGQMRFRDLVSVGPGNTTRFQTTSSDEFIIIWNVTDPLNPTNLYYQYTDEIAEYTLETDSLLEFIAFDESQFLSPVYIGEVENQNLHALEPVDLVIVTHKDFATQAQQLADFRESHDGLSTYVVTPEKIYNEFSSGAQDITAIRDFIKYLYNKSNGEKPENLLLFGDASFDYKSILAPNTNFIPGYESPASLNPVGSFYTDDFFGDMGEIHHLSIGIGRLPAKTTQEANILVQKIIHYSSNEIAYGSWRNDICLIADDEDLNLHFSDSEQLADIIDTSNRTLNISKIYLDAYEQITTPEGQLYPDVNVAITNKINSGVSIINYMGHGFFDGLAYESIFTEEDIENWENNNYFPVMMAATCDFGRFDDPDRYSLAEKILLLENRGMSGIVSPTRATYAGANQALNRKIFYILCNNPEYTFGKILMLAKQQVGSIENRRKFCFLGDPSMRIAIPLNNIVTEAINGVSVSEPLDTINPGEQVIVSGHIEDVEGNVFYNFNGTMEIRVFDRIDTVSTLGNDPQSIVDNFPLRDSVLLTLNTEVLNGQFAFSFNLPYTLDEAYGTIKLSYYGMDFPLDARGEFSEIVVGGPASAISKNKVDQEALAIYPTLVKSELNFVAKRPIQNLQLEVFDLTGRSVQSFSLQNITAGTKRSL